ncbi:WRN RecQ like helicase [Leptinotarsa decemlineata]|uniref:WRN RecQ like helicase n=1 Tax=Leptinotarsa decemlineata TaxID=7539 RepID=UPI003D30882E
MEISTSRILRRQLTPEEKADQTKKLKLEKDKLETEAASKIKRAALRPFIKYQGKIFYHTELIDMAMVCDNLLKKVSESEELLVVGFDLEWPFDFQSGSGRTAVIQISPDLNTCYILHVSKIKYLPKSLSDFLEHDKVRLTGNNVKNDARKLARDFTGVNGDKLVQNCIDLGVLANSILPTTHRWSLEKLVNYLLDLRINKSKMVRNSKWHIIPLSPAQQKYAAIDSHVSLLLYVTLKEKEKDKEDDQNTLNK